MQILSISLMTFRKSGIVSHTRKQHTMVVRARSNGTTSTLAHTLRKYREHKAAYVFLFVLLVVFLVVFLLVFVERANLREGLMAATAFVYIHHSVMPHVFVDNRYIRKNFEALRTFELILHKNNMNT